jgi:hypothetical protein
MTTTPDLVERILNRSMAYAMPLPLLVEAVNREIGGPRVSPEDLLRSLRSRPDPFRTLDPLVGPWRRIAALRWVDGGWAPDPRVIGLSPARRPRSAFVSRLTESLRCLAKQVDERSTTATARWSIHMELASKTLSSAGIPSEGAPSNFWPSV